MKATICIFVLCSVLTIISARPTVDVVTDLLNNVVQNVNNILDKKEKPCTNAHSHPHMDHGGYLPVVVPANPIPYQHPAVYYPNNQYGFAYVPPPQPVGVAGCGSNCVHGNQPVQRNTVTPPRIHTVQTNVQQNQLPIVGGNLLRL